MQIAPRSQQGLHQLIAHIVIGGLRIRLIRQLRVIQSQFPYFPQEIRQIPDRQLHGKDISNKRRLVQPLRKQITSVPGQLPPHFDAKNQIFLINPDSGQGRHGRDHLPGELEGIIISHSLERGILTMVRGPQRNGQLTGDACDVGPNHHPHGIHHSGIGGVNSKLNEHLDDGMQVFGAGGGLRSLG